MKLIIPKIVIFDSATLGEVSHDYWSQDANLREKARFFITNLKHLGIHITLTLTHVSELFRHENEEIVRERFKFLRSVPLIAWLRPYNREWFPGDLPDLLCHEVHAVIYDSAKNLRQIRDKVRPKLWETGMGHKMFVENNNFWANIMRESKNQHEVEKYAASVDRTDPGQIRNMKISELLKFPIRPKEERVHYFQRFCEKMCKQLYRHGDKRLNSSDKIAINFTLKALQNIKTIDTKGKDIKREMLKCPDVPEEFINPEMTMGELGELAVYAKRLKIVSEIMHQPIKLTIRDVHPDALPSYALERKLASIQRKAERVSGSDMGDRRIASMIFYAEGIEVDKRTYEYLNQVKRKDPKLASLMRYFFTSSDYNRIPKFFDE